ncbi:MAG: glycosyltransferase, partial [Phycisphaerales bacterium]|nr:glycosyltransferase [Phycisphaerales bacterium]
MKVLHVISSLDHRYGGPAYALSGLAAHQRAEGLDVSVLTGMRAGDDDALIKGLREAGVPVAVTGPGRGPLGRHPALRRDVAAAIGDADLCHIHAVWSQIQHEAARAARDAGVPYIFRPCGTLDPWCMTQSAFRKKLYLAWRLRRDLNGAVAIHYTTTVERALATPIGLTPEAIVEPNGVDLAEFATPPPPGTLRRKFPEIGARPIVLFLSRVHKKKGLDVLIPAFARAETGDAVLVIAGHDDRGYLATARDLVRDHDLERDVVFTGILRGDDRIGAFTDATLFALTSYQENFGVAVVEALAAGLPVLISDQINIHEEVSAAGVGVVVPMDIAAVADALETWLADEARRAKAAERARPFVRERYEWGAIARRWVERYGG